MAQYQITLNDDLLHGLFQGDFIRNLPDATPKSLQAEVYRRVRAILEAPDLKTARLLLHQVL